MTFQNAIASTVTVIAGIQSKNIFPVQGGGLFCQPNPKLLKIA